MDKLLEATAHLESLGLDVMAWTHQGIFESIHFLDPNGHRLELVADIATPDQMGG